MNTHKKEQNSISEENLTPKQVNVNGMQCVPQAGVRRDRGEVCLPWPAWQSTEGTPAALPGPGGDPEQGAQTARRVRPERAVATPSVRPAAGARDLAESLQTLCPMHPVSLATGSRPCTLAWPVP